MQELAGRDGQDMKVAITGVTGFIGRHLAESFLSAGREVAGLCRTPPEDRVPGLEFYPYDLARRVPEQALAGCSVLVHAAHVLYSRREPAADELNFQGAQRLFSAARKAGVRKILYVSSLSAHSGVDSHYARSKLAVESLLHPGQDLSLRLGLVLGPGGVAKRLQQVLESSRFVPLIDGGRQPVHTVHIDDLCRLVASLAEGPDCGVVQIGHPQAETLARVNRVLARAMRRRVWFVPVPFRLAWTLVGLAERLGLELPLSRENLQGLRGARCMDSTPDRKNSHPTVRSLEELAESGALEEWILPGAPPSSGWTDLLKPTGEEILHYARRETDWQYAPRFEPLTRGPVVALLVLAGVGLAAALMTPARIGRRLLEKGE